MEWKSVKELNSQNVVVLKGLRGREGLTQKQLSEKASLSLSMISRLETGRRIFTPEIAKRLARALKTKIKMFNLDINVITHWAPFSGPPEEE